MAWSALLTFPLMAAVQEICDRTALATGTGLGDLFRARFAGKAKVVVSALTVLLLVANVLNIAADLLAVGAGMHLLHAGPITLWAPLAGVGLTVLTISGSFEFLARALKYLCLALASYVVVLFFSNVPWRTVAWSTIIPHPHASRDYVALVVAVLGTTISPYLLFWQSAHRVEELKADAEGGSRAVTLDERPRVDAKRKERRSRLDVFVGMAISNVVMFSIIVATGATIGRDGSTQIDSAAQAAQALRPFAGSLASVLFAFGFIGSGLLAVPVLAGSSASEAAGLAGKDWGFSQRLRQAPFFYEIVAVGTLGGSLLSLAGINPIDTLIVVALLNGIAAAPFLIIVMVIADDTDIMGHHANHTLAKLLGWGTAAIMTIAAATVIAAILIH